MADRVRQPAPRLGAPPEETGFFELLRRLEAGGARFGRAGGPEREPARLGQGVRLSIAARDIARVHPGTAEAPPFVEVEVIGLLGPEGPMPLHLTRWILERLSHRWFEPGGDDATTDTAALDFCNLLQHRMIALYWRAWGDAQPFLQVDRDGEGRVGALMAALAGIGLPGLRDGEEAQATAAVKLGHAGQIHDQVRGPERLVGPVGAMLGVPVRLVEFVGTWTEIPPPLRSRLGRAFSTLGGDAVAGERAFSRQDRAEIRVGPLGLPVYLALCGDGPLRRRLRHLLLHLAGRELDLDLRLVLAAPEVPEPRLGQVALGRTAWLAARRPGDRDDLRFTRVTQEAA